MRNAYLSAQTRTHLSYQIRTIRCQRGWSQEEFAKRLDTSQSAVSRMEDHQYGKQNLQTLIQVANTFDCGLLVQFVPYDEFIRKTDDLSRETLEVSEFNEAALIPLSENQVPSVTVSSSLDESFKLVATNTGLTLTSPSYHIHVGSQGGSLFATPRLTTQSDQSTSNNRTVDAGKEEKIALLEAENARLKLELDKKRDQTHLLIVGVN